VQLPSPGSVIRKKSSTSKVRENLITNVTDDKINDLDIFANDTWISCTVTTQKIVYGDIYL
jgi:hypothetical protein